jgi:aspartate/methionine/tyrosine aminotransferase
MLGDIATLEFPWDSLEPYHQKAADFAAQNNLEVINVSIGTPVDPVPSKIQLALAAGADTPGYPQTVGNQLLRAAIVKWLKDVRGVSNITEDQICPTVGSKEAVALLPQMLGLKPGDIMVRPKYAYPTYDIGAAACGCEILATDDVQDWLDNPRVKLVWINYPNNPTGACVSVEYLREVIAAARKIGAVVASDECYALMDWRKVFSGYNAPLATDSSGAVQFVQHPERESLSQSSHSISEPQSGHANNDVLSAHVSILTDEVCGGDFSNIIMLYSLSKQLNLAGYRAAFIAGDKKLIADMQLIRKQCGLIMPEPIQRAMVVALEDKEDTALQVERYRVRHQKLRRAFDAAGYQIDHSEGSLYLWVKTKHDDCWGEIDYLANLGIIAAPGVYYDESATDHIRVSVTATDEQIDELCRRLGNA